MTRTYSFLVLAVSKWVMILDALIKLVSSSPRKVSLSAGLGGKCYRQTDKSCRKGGGRIPVNTNIYKSILKSTFGLSLGAIWQHMTVELFNTSTSYACRVDMFFSLMEKMMLEGNVKLAHDGLYLDGAIQHQLGILRDAWPKDPGEDDLDGFGFWFITEAPAGVVWIDSGGKEFWC